MPLITPKNPPQMIVIFPDDELAFDAYRFLQSNGISPENMVLIGEGFSSPEYLSCLMPPKEIARQSGLNAMVMGLKVGFVACLLIVILVFYFKFLSWIITILICGAVLTTTTLLAGLGGWLFGFFHRSHISTKCRSYLRQGQYLLLLEGSESLIRRGREILHSYSNRYDF